MPGAQEGGTAAIPIGAMDFAGGIAVISGGASHFQGAPAVDRPGFPG
ncbi:MAG: hypothetical protein SPK07_08780 [Coriobacteriales bacterium]|nr:hypothetical protein [Coriobacteriales bacterium]